MKVLHCTAWMVGLSLLAALATPALAAGKHDQGAALQGMVAQLDVTPEQQAKIDPIISDFQQQVISIRKEGKASGDMDTARSKMKDARHETIKKISDVLTDDQRTKFRDLLKQAEQAHKAAKAAGATTQPAAQ